MTLRRDEANLKLAACPACGVQKGKGDICPGCGYEPRPRVRPRHVKHSKGAALDPEYGAWANLVKGEA